MQSSIKTKHFFMRLE